MTFLRFIISITIITALTVYTSSTTLLLYARVPANAQAYIDRIRDPNKLEIVRAIYNHFIPSFKFRGEIDPLRPHTGANDGNCVDNSADTDGGAYAPGVPIISATFSPLTREQATFFDVKFAGFPSPLSFDLPDYLQDDFQQAHRNFLRQFEVTFTLKGVKSKHQFEIEQSNNCEKPTPPTLSSSSPPREDESKSWDLDYRFPEQQQMSRSISNSRQCPTHPIRELRAFDNTLPTQTAQFEFSFHPLVVSERTLTLSFDIDLGPNSDEDEMTLDDAITFDPVITSLHPPMEFLPIDYPQPFTHDVSMSAVETMTPLFTDVDGQEICEKNFKFTFNHTQIPLYSTNNLELYSHFPSFNFIVIQNEEFAHLKNTNDDELDDPSQFEASSNPNRPYFDHYCELVYSEPLSTKGIRLIVDSYITYSNETQPNLTLENYQLNLQLERENSPKLNNNGENKRTYMDSTFYNDDEDTAQRTIPKTITLNLTSVPDLFIPVGSRLVITCSSFRAESPSANWDWSQFWVMRIRNLTLDQSRIANPNHSGDGSSTNNLDNNADDGDIAFYATVYTKGIDRSDYIAPFLYLVVLTTLVIVIITIMTLFAKGCQRWCHCCRERDQRGQYDHYHPIN